MESGQSYFGRFGVESAVTAAIEQVLATRPVDPMATISDFLLSRLPASVVAPGRTTVGTLLDEASSGGSLAGKLEGLGLEATRASAFAAAAQRLLDAGVAPSTHASAFWVPGRIEVAGKHTDYAGGRSLLCAVNRGFAVVSAERPDAVCRLLATFELTGATDEAVVRLDGASSGEELPSGWALYPAVTARRLARNFAIDGGVDLAMSCDLPEASGMLIAADCC